MVISDEAKRAIENNPELKELFDYVNKKAEQAVNDLIEQAMVAMIKGNKIRGKSMTNLVIILTALVELYAQTVSGIFSGKMAAALSIYQNMNDAEFMKGAFDPTFQKWFDNLHREAGK